MLPAAKMDSAKEWIGWVMEMGQGASRNITLQNLAATSSAVVQSMYCCLRYFAFTSEFWQQFGSFVAFFLPRSVLKLHFNCEKEKKMSFGSAP